MAFCSDCECNEEGSMDSTCNGDGQCTCKANIQGEICDNCTDGYFDFPNCTRFRVSSTGTITIPALTTIFLALFLLSKTLNTTKYYDY